MDKKHFDFNLEGDEEGVIYGYASIFNIKDQHNDLITEGSFKNLINNKIKFLWQHKPEEPIGLIEEIKEDKYGLYFKAKLLLDLPQARAAYSLLKAKAISGVSIGFKPIKFHYKGDIRIIEEIDLWEISLVTFPANIEANIIEVKNKKHLGEKMKVNEDQQQVWENFKSVNEDILNLKNQNRVIDPLLGQQLSRMNEHLDEYKNRLDLLETTMSRPFVHNDNINSHFDKEHKNIFNNYLRTGNENNLAKIEQKALSASSDADGGYLITRETSKQIAQILQEISPMRNLASYEKISSSSLDVIEDYDNAQAGWTSEMSAVNDTDTPKISKRNIPVFELYAQPSATQKLIDDSSVDIERWLADKLINSFSKLENQAFINGDGSSCPRGILTYSDGKELGNIQQVSSGVEGGFDADSLFRLYFSLKERYCSNASFMMNRFTIHSIRTLKDKNTGRYLWNPGLSDGTPDTLLGVSVHEASDMPVAAKDALIIAFADFKSAYKVVDREGIRVLRDPYTFKPFVKFYTTRRVGGDIINFEAIKLLKLSA